MKGTKLRTTSAGIGPFLRTNEANERPFCGLIARPVSHIQFDESIQKWIVRAWRPRSRARRFLQWLTGRSFGETLRMADSREQALDWEQRHYGIGGPGWQELF